MSTPRPPIDYRLREVEPVSRSIFSIAGLLCGIAFALYLVVMFQQTAKFVEIYRDFNLTLPSVTQAFVDAAWWVENKTFYSALLLPPLAGAFGLPLLFRLLPRDPIRLMRGIFGLLILILLVVVLDLVQDLVLGSPIYTLFSGMSGGNNKK